MPPPTPEEITPEFLATCCGGSEQMPPFLRSWAATMRVHGLLGPGPALATRRFESQGVMPEYFPGAYDDREFWERARDRNTETADFLTN